MHPPNKLHWSDHQHGWVSGFSGTFDILITDSCDLLRDIPADVFRAVPLDRAQRVDDAWIPDALVALRWQVALVPLIDAASEEVSPLRLAHHNVCRLYQHLSAT